MGEVLISIHENEDRDLRHRRGAVPGDQLPGRDEALQGVEARDREEARRAGHHAAVRGAVGAAGHLRQEGPQHDRGHEGPEVARLQCRHRAHRRNRRRAVGDDPGGRTAAGARDRRGQLVHVVGRDRLRQQGLGDADALLRHAGVDPEELHLREQGGVRRARQADAGRDPEGRGDRRGARLEGLGGQGQLVSRPAQGQGHEGAGRRARRSKTGFKKVGEQLTADWLKKAGADGQAIVDAYKKM